LQPLCSTLAAMLITFGIRAAGSFTVCYISAMALAPGPKLKTTKDGGIYE